MNYSKLWGKALHIIDSYRAHHMRLSELGPGPLEPEVNFYIPFVCDSGRSRTFEFSRVFNPDSWSDMEHSRFEPDIKKEDPFWIEMIRRYLEARRKARVLSLVIHDVKEGQDGFVFSFSAEVPDVFSDHPVRTMAGKLFLTLDADYVIPEFLEFPTVTASTTAKIENVLPFKKV
jgi:hypothetical protein